MYCDVVYCDVVYCDVLYCDVLHFIFEELSSIKGPTGSILISWFTPVKVLLINLL